LIGKKNLNSVFEREKRGPWVKNILEEMLTRNPRRLGGRRRVGIGNCGKREDGEVKNLHLHTKSSKGRRT